jgi:hypothetical protein
MFPRPNSSVCIGDVVNFLADPVVRDAFTRDWDAYYLAREIVSEIDRFFGHNLASYAEIPEETAKSFFELVERVNKALPPPLVLASSCESPVSSRDSPHRKASLRLIKSFEKPPF